MAQRAGLEALEALAVTQPPRVVNSETLVRRADVDQSRASNSASRGLVSGAWDQRNRLVLFAANGMNVFALGLLIQVILVRYAGMGHVSSYVVQTVASVQLSFLLSRYVTWRDRDLAFVRAATRFNVQQLAVTGLGMAGYAGLERLGMNYITANVAVTAVLTPVSFVSSHKWSMDERTPRRRRPRRKLACEEDATETMMFPALRDAAPTKVIERVNGAALAPRTVSESPYTGESRITGELQEGNEVKYVKTLSRRQELMLWVLLGVSVLGGLVLLSWLGWMTELMLSIDRSDPVPAKVSIVSISALMALIEIIRITQSLTLGYFTVMARDPVPLIPSTNLRVAVMTTIVPGNEPWDLVKATLLEMKQIRYPGIMDVWILDEGDDPVIKADCLSMGVNHFSRRGVEEWNMPTGSYRRKSKSGNHNSWRAKYEHNYDVVAQMDPDHVPVPEFLERTLGYFNDPDVGFVVAPQVYGRNWNESWIARASAVLAYVFHGVIQRGLNGLHAPLLIGTNHLYRTVCWRQVGGYRDKLVEDHATCMQVYAAENPATGNRWKGVYTPDIIADGEGPSSFTDFFNQQKRWAYGIWQVVFTDSGHVLPLLSRPQQVAFAMLQQFYPSACISWLGSMMLTAMFLFSGVATRLPIAGWAVLWSISITSSLFLFFWLRRFNLVEHERKQWGMLGVYLMLMTIPTYVEAGIAFCFGCPLNYVVTAKGHLASSDKLKTFGPNLCWLLVACVFCAFPSFLATHIWMAFVAVLCAAPVAMHYYSQVKSWFQERREGSSAIWKQVE